MSSHPEEPKDIRLEATRLIGAFAVAMLGISIPLSAITESGQLPGLIIIGSVISTAAVWAFGGRQSAPLPKSLTEEQKRIKELEERLANLEMMDSYERQVAIERQIGVETEVPSPPYGGVSVEKPSASYRSRPVAQ